MTACNVVSLYQKIHHIFGKKGENDTRTFFPLLTKYLLNWNMLFPFEPYAAQTFITQNIQRTIMTLLSNIILPFTLFHVICPIRDIRRSPTRI